MHIRLLLPALTALLLLLGAGCSGSSSSSGGSSLQEGTQAGMLAPDFRLPHLTSDGEEHLSALRGKVVVLTFWASWCGPCRQEVPALEEVWRKYKEAPFTLLGISVDDRREDAMRFMDFLAGRVTYPMLLDQGGDVADRYGVETIPMLWLVDKEGRVVERHRGFSPGALKALSQEIGTLVAR